MKWAWTVFAIAFLAGPSVMAQPKLEVETTTIEFGLVDQGTITERTLTVRNSGDADLVIERTASSCPCATVEAPEGAAARLAPGEERALTVTYDPKDLVGERFATVVIHSNDPASPATILETSAYIRVPVLARPHDGIAFGLAPRGEALAKDWVLKPGSPEHDIELISVTVDSPHITPHAEKRTEENAPIVRVTFDLAEDAPLDRLETAVHATVRVNGAEHTLSVPMVGSVLGDVLITPPTIISPQSLRAPGERISTITVRSPRQGQAPPDIIDVFAEGPLAATIRNNVTPESHEIDVLTGTIVPGGPLSGRIWVITQSKDQPIVRIPVFFQGRDAVVADPPYLAGAVGKGIDAAISLTRPDGKPLTITGVDADESIVRIARPHATHATHGAEPAQVIVQISPERANAPLSTLITFQTDAPGGEIVHVPVVIR